MRRKRSLAALLAGTALWIGFGTTPPAQACGYEDIVCDVIEYARDRACVKFRVCL